VLNANEVFIVTGGERVLALMGVAWEWSL